jgi:hypothetical protein
LDENAHRVVGDIDDALDRWVRQAGL